MEEFNYNEYTGGGTTTITSYPTFYPNIVVDGEELNSAESEDPRIGRQAIEVVAKGKTFTGETSCTGGTCLIPQFKDTDDDLVKKFCDNTLNVLSPDKANQAAQQMLNLDKVENVNRILEMVAP